MTKEELHVAKAIVVLPSCSEAHLILNEVADSLLHMSSECLPRESMPGIKPSELRSTKGNAVNMSRALD